MARRKELKSIASGVLGSFISRNNDLFGYWGIGVLCLQAKKMQSDVFCLDLLNQTVTPVNEYALLLTNKYRKMMFDAFEKQKLSLLWINSALLRIHFNPDYVAKFHRIDSRFDNRYTCSLEIIDDLDKKHCVKLGGKCWPHDANRELRRQN